MASITRLERIAEHLYTVYCAAVGGRAFNGDPLPEWAEFRADPNKRKQSDGWIVVAKAVIRYLADYRE